MMMHVVDQRHAFGLADRQQIGGREGLVVVLDGQAASDPVRQPFQIAGEIGQCLLLVAVGSAAMDVDDIGPDPLGDFCLVFKLLDRLLNHVGAGRVQHHELIGVKAGSQLVLPGELSAFLEPTNDFIAFRQIIDLIPAVGCVLIGRIWLLMRKQPMSLSAQNWSEASRASAFARQRRLNFARASGRFILPMAVAVVVTNLIG